MPPQIVPLQTLPPQTLRVQALRVLTAAAVPVALLLGTWALTGVGTAGAVVAGPVGLADFVAPAADSSVDQSGPQELSAEARYHHGGVSQVMRHAPGVIWMGRGPRLVALDPGAPGDHRVLGESEPLGGTLRDLAIGGVQPNASGGDPTRGWALTTGDRLVALDIRGPGEIEVLAVTDVQTNTLGLAAVGESVFVAGRYGTLTGYRLADRSGGPQLESFGRLDLGVDLGSLGGIAALDGHLVVAARIAEAPTPMLHVVRVGPGSLSVVGTLDTLWPDGAAVHMTVDGDTVWIATANGELLSVSLDDPSSPEVMSMVDTDSYCLDLLVADGQAFITGGDPGHNAYNVDVVSVRNPKSIGNPVGGRRLPRLSDLAGGVAVVNGHLWYATESGHLITLDVTDPANGMPVVGRSFGMGHASDLALGDDVSLLGGAESTHVLNTAWPTWPHSVTETLLHHYPNSVAVTGTTGLVVSGGMMDVMNSGLLALDLAHPTRPAASWPYFQYRLDSLRLWGRLGTLVVTDWQSNSGLTGSQHRVELLDVSNPVSPTTVGRVQRPNGLQAAAIQTDTLVAVGPGFYSDAAEALELITADIGDPAAPSLLGSVVLAEDPGRSAVANLALDGSHAYIAAAGRGSQWTVIRHSALHVVDLTDPASPVEVAEIPLEVPAGTPTVVYGYLLLPTVGGALVFDVADPTAPERLGMLVTGADRVAEVVVDDGLVLMPSGSAGIYVLWPQLERWPEPDFDAPPTPTALPPVTATETPQRPTVTPPASRGSIYLPIAEAVSGTP